LPVVAIGPAFARAASPAPREDSRRDLLIGATVVSALALLIRALTVTSQSLWLDEDYTYRLVHLSFGGMLSAIPKSESTPPLYYVLTWVWTHLFGFSELAVRSVSALAGVATVAVAYALAARLGGARAALIAGGLVAISPAMVWYSQEARAYSLAALLATATILCALRYLESLDGRWLAAWAVTAALGLGTHYFVAFVVLPEFVWILWRHGHRREVQRAAALVVAVGIALVPLALAQRGTGHADYIASTGLATRTVQIPKQLLVGYASPGQVITAVLAAVIVVLGSLWPLARYRDSIVTPTVITLVAGLSCLVLPLILALVGVDFLDTRNVLPALPALLVVAGVGFALPRAWPLGGGLAAALVAVLAVIVVLVNTNPVYQRADWRGASAALGPAHDTRAIVVSSAAGQLQLQPYLRGLRPFGTVERVQEIDIVGIPAESSGGGLGPAPRPVSPLPMPSQFHLVSADYNRVYTVLRYRARRAAAVSAGLLAPLHPGFGTFSIVIQTPAR
jgi:mannosyltransferase